MKELMWTIGIIVFVFNIAASIALVDVRIGLEKEREVATLVLEDAKSYRTMRDMGFEEWAASHCEDQSDAHR